ncbi:PPOX class F420-dependent oxidoreductase [Geodermatophilus sp. SYSU D00703]
MAFSDDEVAYLRSHGIGRLATVGEDEQPDVVPVAVEFDGTHFWVGGPGATVLTTRKFRNVGAGRRKVALVMDDLPSLDPFVARGIRVYGVADGPVERAGMVGPGFFLRITPRVSWSWNTAGEPVGGAWYETRRAVHAGGPPADGA